jgi:hypothetical protein
MPIGRGIWISSIVGMFISGGGRRPCGSGQGSADVGALGPVGDLPRRLLVRGQIITRFGI